MKIVCIGDSLTYGFGVHLKQRWTAIAAAETEYEIINRGVNGDTTGGMLARLQDCLTIKPDVVLVMGGYNDIFYSGTDTNARANIGAAVQQILAKGAMPMVGIPYNIDSNFCPEDWSLLADFNGAESLLKEYCNWLKKYCKVFNIETIDFSGCILPGYLLDGLHPNPAGHAAMAKIFIDRIKEIAGNN